MKIVINGFVVETESVSEARELLGVSSSVSEQEKNIVNRKFKPRGPGKKFLVSNNQETSGLVVKKDGRTASHVSWLPEEIEFIIKNVDQDHKSIEKSDFLLKRHSSKGIQQMVWKVMNNPQNRKGHGENQKLIDEYHSNKPLKSTATEVQLDSTVVSKLPKKRFSFLKP